MQLQIGIDWSEKKHDVVLVDEKGKRLSHKVIAHTLVGFSQIDTMRKQAGIESQDCVIGLETAHNLLIDYLWEVGYERVYVLPPNVINASRDRYRQGGARDDKSDAYVIADMLRTDIHRFYPWRPGSALLQQMRTTTSLGQFWTKESVALSNRLRSVLLRYYPAALNVFKSWPSPIACHFVLAYPTPETAAALSYDDFKVFLKRHGHTQSRTWLASYDSLQDDYPSAPPSLVVAYEAEAVQLAQALLNALVNKRETLTRLQELFCQHPDHAIFDSLPGAGKLLAPALLVKFGEDRQRFPTAAIVQALAGTCPVTKRSGKYKSIQFRRACDKDFRYFMQQFARCSRTESEWAAAYFQSASERCRSDNHALRCLANRWISIIWKMWQDQKLYDESFHLQQRMTRRQPKS